MRDKRCQVKPLKGKVAIVTGASRGAGRGIALVLGDAGATVYLTGRSVRGDASSDLPHTTLEDTAEMMATRGGFGVPVRTDHSNDEETRALFERVAYDQGKLDVLVNNAWGGYEKPEGPHQDGKPFWQWSLGHWRKAVEVGVASNLSASYYAVPLMLPQQSGLIVNITLNVSEYTPGWLFYYLPKRSINEMTRAMALDLEAYGIAAVGVSPGWMRTEAVMSGELYPAPDGAQLEETESVELVGRGVLALATDLGVMERSGRILLSRDLAREYDFADVDGRRPV